MKIERILKNIRDKSVIIDEADKFFNRNLKTDKQANNQIQVVNQNKSATERIRTTQSPGSGNPIPQYTSLFASETRSSYTSLVMYKKNCTP